MRLRRILVIRTYALIRARVIGRLGEPRGAVFETSQANGELDTRVHAELPEHPTQVRAYGLFGEREARPDVRVGQPRSHERGDLTFTRR